MTKNFFVLSCIVASSFVHASEPQKLQSPRSNSPRQHSPRISRDVSDLSPLRRRQDSNPIARVKNQYPEENVIEKSVNDLRRRSLGMEIKVDKDDRK